MTVYQIKAGFFLHDAIYD